MLNELTVDGSKTGEVHTFGMSWEATMDRKSSRRYSYLVKHSRNHGSRRMLFSFANGR